MIPVYALDYFGRRVRVEDPPACDLCGREIRSGDIVTLDGDLFDSGCSVIAAATIAQSVLGGSDETVRAVRDAAERLEIAARMLRARLAGKVTP